MNRIASVLGVVGVLVITACRSCPEPKTIEVQLGAVRHSDEFFDDFGFRRSRQWCDDLHQSNMLPAVSIGTSIPLKDHFSLNPKGSLEYGTVERVGSPFVAPNAIGDAGMTYDEDVWVATAACFLCYSTGKDVRFHAGVGPIVGYIRDEISGTGFSDTEEDVGLGIAAEALVEVKLDSRNSVALQLGVQWSDIPVKLDRPESCDNLGGWQPFIGLSFEL